VGILASEFDVAHQSVETLKGFLNTVLAELWVERGRRRLGEDLPAARGVPVGNGAGAGVAARGRVDVQDDRLEVEVKAYGRGKESWSVDYT